MRPETLKKQVYERILDGIIRKEYPVDSILKEKELSDQFGVSKAPVREALIELSKEDIVRSIPRAGYRIVQFTEKDIREATELRLMLEVPSVSRIIGQIRKDEIERLYAMVDEFNYTKHGVTVPLDTWWHNNTRFHLALNAAARNTLVTATLENTLHRLWRAIAQLFWTGNPDEYLSFESDTHQSLIAAIEEKNQAAAEDVLTRDVISIEEKFSFRGR
ncbi:GntR family transcriptional regulator [Breznakiella homolactica]|uniref:GntR family transcriptional regulator n=1 Tax=Breznakiella homolactica TaxID=2798577 RepID=A0A7T8BA53_9SPIR|nr:GntR family transcriptional regulator [Breznakiella homolactica]QQO10309.1 GntR family transcriptional regulator [Breznakiella homolactica]